MIENQTITKMITQLEKYWDENQFLSYDYYDIWATRLGKYFKAKFYKKNLITKGIISVIILTDLLFPNIRRFISEKKIHPISLAHFGIGYLNLLKSGFSEEYLDKAFELERYLMECNTQTKNGIGWGLNFDWMTVEGLVKKNTPCITQTYYPYKFYFLLAEITNEKRYNNILESIAEHIFNDYFEINYHQFIASSYSINDKRIVFNANAYKATILLHYGYNFNSEKFIKKGTETLKYILTNQNKDGSWYYSETEKFIDNYHTAFILKNLLEIKSLMKTNDMLEKIDFALKKGWNYYRLNLLYDNGLPKPYSQKTRIVIHKYDSYDFAEYINLLIEYNKLENIQEILSIMDKILFQKNGSIIFRSYKLPLPNIAYIRYANSAFFLSLTKLVLKNSGTKNK